MRRWPAVSANPSGMSEPPSDAAGQADDLVRFFRALRGPARDAYLALAEADRTYGEDVAAEGDGKEQT